MRLLLFYHKVALPKSGKDGSDAKRYQEQDVMAALEELDRLEKGDEL